MIMEKQFKDKTLEELGCSLEELENSDEFKDLERECIYKENKFRRINGYKYIKQKDLALFTSSNQSSVSKLSKGGINLLVPKDTILAYAMKKAVECLDNYLSLY